MAAHGRVAACLIIVLCSATTILGEHPNVEEAQKHSSLPLTDAEMLRVTGVVLIDTGFEGVAVRSADFQQKLKESDYRESRKMLTDGYDTKAISSWSGVPLSLSNTPSQAVDVVSMDLSVFDKQMGSRLTFVVGEPTIRSFVLSIDRNVSNVRLTRTVDAGRYREWVPITRNARNQPLIPVTIPVIGTRELLLDTGSNGTISLTASRLSALKRMGVAIELNDDVEFTTGTGRQTSRRFVLRQIQFGALILHDVSIIVAPTEKIGMGILRYLDVAIDFPNHKLHYSMPTASAMPHRVPPSAAGIEHFFDGMGNLKVIRVKQHSAAADAKLLAEDLITHINEKRIRDLTIWQIRDTFCQAGETVQLTIQRNQQTFDVDLHLRHPFPYPPEWPPAPVEFNPD